MCLISRSNVSRFADPLIKIRFISMLLKRAAYIHLVEVTSYFISGVVKRFQKL